MATSQTPYAHPGPGPSTVYYHQQQPYGYNGDPNYPHGYPQQYSPHSPGYPPNSYNPRQHPRHPHYTHTPPPQSPSHYSAYPMSPRHQPYPTYTGYPNPNAPAYAPSWSNRSPLPKQLFTPQENGAQKQVHQSLPPQSHEKPQSHEHSHTQEHPQAEEHPQTQPEPEPQVQSESDPQERSESEPQTKPGQSTEKAAPLNFSVPSTSVDPSNSPKSSTVTTFTTNSTTNSTQNGDQTTPVGRWAIWSRRPRDPANAPGIIISPRAQPPSHVVVQALSIPSPPASPPPPPAPSLPVEKEKKKEAISVPEDVSVPSSAVTEAETITTAPGSPASTSNTSLHVSPKQQSASAVLATSTEPTAPAPAPATPVKKSWASLLRPASSSVSSATVLTPPGYTKLPTSSVVGFSVPAESSSSSTPTTASSNLPSAKRTALSSLLSPSSPVPMKTSDMKIRPRGLVNQGNMCFANSVLQMLVYCPPFHGLFAELGKVMMSSEGKEIEDTETPLVKATVEFLGEFIGGGSGGASGSGTATPAKGEWEERIARSAHAGGSSKNASKGKEKAAEGTWELSEEGSFLPLNVYDAMKEKKQFDGMRGGQQEDAEEFFGFYLDTLEEELLALANNASAQQQRASAAAGQVVQKEEEEKPEGDGWLEVGKKNRTVVTRTIKNTESPITKIFGGKFRSTLKAPGQKDSVIVEDWRSLRLDVQRDQVQSIQDALASISHPQSVSLSHHVEGSQQVLIESLPPILVLHMKRFCYDTSVGGVVKVGKYVRFGPELEIGPELMSPNVRKPLPTKYKLFGVLYHHGQSAGGGHYTLDVLHPTRFGKKEEGWMRVDDELVSDVRMDDVFGPKSEREDGKCAYLLFYRKVGR